MIINRILKRSTVIAASFLVTGSATAQVASQGLPAGANTSRSFVDASIIRDSGINQPLDLLNDFYPAVEVTVEDHDNVRRRPGFDEDDLLIAVKPSLAYRTNIGRHKFYVAYSGVFTFHNDFDNEDAEANTLIANLGLDLTRRWDLTLFAGVGDSFEQRGISGSRSFNQLIPGGIDSGPDEVEFDTIGADLIYGRGVSPLNAVLGFERNSSRYKNNGQGDSNPFGNRDREITSVHFDLSYKIGAKTSLFGRIQQSDVDYDRSINSLDSEQTDFLLGLRWKPSNSLSGVVGVGTSEKEFDNPELSDFDGDTYYVNLNYTLNPFSVIQLSASRAVEEPGDDLSDFYESDLLGIGWNHAITPKLIFNSYAKWIEDDYNNDREDEFFDFGIGLDYVWKSWLTAGIYYGELERESNVEGFDYEDSYIGIRLRSDLRPLLEGRGSRVEPDSFDYPGQPNK